MNTMAPGKTLTSAIEQGRTLWISWEEAETAVYIHVDIPANQAVLRGGFAQVDGFISAEDE